MYFEPTTFYHLYNRGNNKQRIFFSDDNYKYFLRKATQALTRYSDILAYCLMPNHFHFLIYTKDEHGSGQTTGAERSNTQVRSVGIGYIQDHGLANSRPTTSPPQLQPLTRNIAHMLSSYTRAINKQNQSTGSLFQQKTKAKPLQEDGYPHTCFHYIHQNPLKAGLVKRIEDWPHSSFREYMHGLNDRVCNHGLAKEMLEIDMDTFYEDSQKAIDPEQIERLF